MSMRNLLTASIAALSLTAVAAPAQAQISGEVTIGIGDRSNWDYSRDRDRDGYYDRYEDDRGTRWDPNGRYRIDPYYGYPQYSRQGYCGFNSTQLVMNNLRTTAGRIVLANDRGTNGFDWGDRLSGVQFRPTSRMCVSTRGIEYGRVAIIHDVNNNGRFDWRDGIGYPFASNYPTNTRYVTFRYRY